MTIRTAPQPECHSRLMKLLPGIYYILKHTNRWEVVSVTEQSESLLGYTPEEIEHLSSDFFERSIHPEDFQALRERKNQSMQENKLYVSEYRMYSRRKELKFVRDQYTCYEQDGEWFMEGYVSEVVQSGIRDRLLQQLQAYRNAVDFNMISSITDAGGKIVYANENFCRISKYNLWELVGQNHRIVNSRHHHHEFFADMWKRISAGEPWHGEILNRAKDGTVYWVDTVIIPIFNEDKKIVNYLSLRLLINDRKEAEKHRQNYVKLLEKVAFVVAHDVRAPLCSILGLTDILLNYDNTTAEGKLALKHLQQAAAQLNSITQKLSLFLYETEQEMNLQDPS